MSDNNLSIKRFTILKRVFQIFGRTIMSLIFIVCLLVPILAFTVFYGELMKQDFPYDFFGILLPIPVIALILSLILLPFGIYGIIIVIKMIKSRLIKKIYPLSWRPKTAVLLIIAMALVGFFYYTPFWYLNIGIKPKFGPYIAYFGEDSMMVSWDSTRPTESKIIYGTDPDNLLSEEFGGEYYWETDELTLHHAVKLEGLQEGTKYYYKIPGFSNDLYYFYTVPDSIKPVTFTIVGDTQGNFNIQQNNMKWMSKIQETSGINFTVIVGDIVNDDDDMNEWAMIMNEKSWGKISPYVPWHTTSGNHECGCDNDDCETRENYKKFFQNNFRDGWVEDNLWDVDTSYSFNYSNVHMVMLDVFANRTSTLTQEQFDWLDEDLSRNVDNWKFITFHLSLYSTSDHGPYPDLQEQLEPLFWKHQVDAVFYGHDHIYESYHINSSETYGGTYAFMCAGGGGSLKKVLDLGDRSWNGTTNSYGNLINIVSGDTEGRFDELAGYEYQLYAERTHHYMKVDVEDQIATFSAYRTLDNSLIEEYTVHRTSN